MQRPDESLSEEERQFVERLREEYLPAPRGASQRAAFRTRLADRLGRGGVPVWQPLTAAACAAAFALWLVLSGGPVGDDVAGVRNSSEDADVLVAFALSEEGLAERGDLLPDDYALLADVLDL